jgi:hypothetical protein
MSRRLFVAGIMMVGASLAQARGEEVALFQATKAGEEAWVWGSARAKFKGGKIIVSLHDKDAGAGNAYVATRFPYFSSGKVELTASEVAAGDYTLQVLGFKNGAHIDTAEVIAHATAPAKKSFLLKDAGLTNGVDEILFKVWVGGAKDAATTIEELTYSLSLEGSEVLLDERFQNMDAWDNESLVLRLTGEGALLSLKPDTTFGSILLRKQFTKQDGLRLLWNIARIDNGDATLQIVGFDKDGKYVNSWDGVKNVRGGWHAVSFPMPGWPPEVESFQIKLWVGGQPTAVAKFDRLLLVKSAP